MFKPFRRSDSLIRSQGKGLLLAPPGVLTCSRIEAGTFRPARI